MVEIGKIGNKTLVMDGKILHLFKKGELLRRMWYGGYEDFDGANGGVWKKYINIPIKDVPIEYAQYLIVIDDTNVSVYNVEGSLKTQSSIASEFWELVRNDGFDIRVFDHLFNQLWFCVKEFDYVSKIAKIWVLLPENSEELNIAYGNEKASQSIYNNPEQVFELFDDFLGNALDTNKWKVTDLDSGVSYSVKDSNLILTASGKYSTWQHIVIQSLASFGSGYAVEFKGKVTESANTGIDKYFTSGLINFIERNSSVCFDNGVTTHIWIYEEPDVVNHYVRVNDTGYLTKVTTPPFPAVFRVTYGVDKSIMLINDSVEHIEPHAPTISMPISFVLSQGATSGTITAYIDWVGVLKLDDPATFYSPRILEF